MLSDKYIYVYFLKRNSSLLSQTVTSPLAAVHQIEIFIGGRKEGFKTFSRLGSRRIKILILKRVCPSIDPERFSHHQRPYPKQLRSFGWVKVLCLAHPNNRLYNRLFYFCFSNQKNLGGLVCIWNTLLSTNIRSTNLAPSSTFVMFWSSPIGT